MKIMKNNDDEDDEIIEDDFTDIYDNDSKYNNAYKEYYDKFVKEHIKMNKLLSMGYTKYKNKMILFICFLEYLQENPILEGKRGVKKTNLSHLTPEEKIEYTKNRQKELYNRKNLNKSKRTRNKIDPNETPEQKTKRIKSYSEKSVTKRKLRESFNDTISFE